VVPIGGQFGQLFDFLDEVCRPLQFVRQGDQAAVNGIAVRIVMDRRLGQASALRRCLPTLRGCLPDVCGGCHHCALLQFPNREGNRGR
jgi:hypothetical protein